MSTKLSKGDVEKTVAYFNNTSEFPQSDPKAVARMAVEFERFSRAVQKGMVEDGPAMELASSFVVFGNQWLQSHPEAQLARDRFWTFDRVKAAIAYFNNTTAVPETDTDGMKKLVAEFDAFEGAVKDGWVEDGDAKALAAEFSKIAGAWFDKNPAMKALRGTAPVARAR